MKHVTVHARNQAYKMMTYVGRSWLDSFQNVASTFIGEPSTGLGGEEEPMATGGENSRMSRVVGEKRFVVKRRPESRDARKVAALQRWYQREIYWYTSLAKQCEDVVRCPRCERASYSAVTGAFVLVLEDLSSDSWSPLVDLERAIATLGKLHKRWRGVDLDELPKTPIHLELAPLIEKYFQQAWVHVKVNYSFAKDVLNLIDSLALDGVYTSHVRKLVETENVTLVHGDFRPSNMVQRGSDEVCVFDWQFACTGAGAYDFAYFLALSTTIQERKDKEDRMTEVYVENGGRLALGELYNAVLVALASFVMGAYTAVDHELHQQGIDRLAAAALDWREK